jgi:carbon monoxide dehydrogenase subunit G
MIEQTGTYEIEHKIDEVFNYISQPNNLSELSPTIEESKGKGQSDNGGSIIEVDYEVAGGIASGTSTLEPERYVQNKVIKYTIDDDISGFIKWEFKNDGDSTILRYSAQYEVKIPVPDIFLNTVGQRVSQNELDSIIENLRSGLGT